MNGIAAGRIQAANVRASAPGGPSARGGIRMLTYRPMTRSALLCLVSCLSAACDNGVGGGGDGAAGGAPSGSSGAAGAESGAGGGGATTGSGGGLGGGGGAGAGG